MTAQGICRIAGQNTNLINDKPHANCEKKIAVLHYWLSLFGVAYRMHSTDKTVDRIGTKLHISTHTNIIFHVFVIVCIGKSRGSAVEYV